MYKLEKRHLDRFIEGIEGSDVDISDIKLDAFNSQEELDSGDYIDVQLFFSFLIGEDSSYEVPIEFVCRATGEPVVVLPVRLYDSLTIDDNIDVKDYILYQTALGVIELFRLPYDCYLGEPKCTTHLDGNVLQVVTSFRTDGSVIKQITRRYPHLTNPNYEDPDSNFEVNQHYTSMRTNLLNNDGKSELPTDFFTVFQNWIKSTKRPVGTYGLVKSNYGTGKHIYGDGGIVNDPITTILKENNFEEFLKSMVEGSVFECKGSGLIPDVTFTFKDNVVSVDTEDLSGMFQPFKIKIEDNALTAEQYDFLWKYGGSVSLIQKINSFYGEVLPELINHYNEQ